MASPHFIPLLLFFILPLVSAEIQSISFAKPFDESSASSLKTLGNARIDNQALQLTTDTSNEERFVANNSGRIIYDNPFKVWDSNHSAKNVFSFNSSFLFNIYPIKYKPVGEGLAFAIFRDNKLIPENSYGGFLGLTNSSTDGNFTNRFVAVEFDTFKQPFDPDDNHVALDINGVRSAVAISLAEFNMTLAPLQEHGVNYRAWVEYSGPLRRMQVYLSEENHAKPDAPLINATVDLSDYLAKNSYFGFSGSTGQQFQLNCVLSWNLSVEILPRNDETENPLSWVLKVGVPTAAAAVLAAACYGSWTYRRRQKHAEIEMTSLENPKRYEYKELKEATRNFHAENLLGRGGFGEVYKGVIPGQNDEVAVKRFHRDTMLEDFRNELSVINRLRHRNLVPLLGWCHQGRTLLLVYEFMRNGSLDQYLFSAGSAAPPLPWSHRKQILTGVASALHYLHNLCDGAVVHRDIKANNIMLDKDYNGRLGDFGLAKVIESRRSSTSEAVVGTVGYVAPEYLDTGKATDKTDVFAFGVVILEVVSGRKSGNPIEGSDSLVSWVLNLYRSKLLLNAVDSRLRGDISEEDAKKFLYLGLACCRRDPGDRPETRSLLSVISGDSVPGRFHFRGPNRIAG